MKKTKFILVVNDLALWTSIFSDVLKSGGSIQIYPFSRKDSKIYKALFWICNNHYTKNLLQRFWIYYSLKKWSITHKKETFVLFLNPVLLDIPENLLTLLIKRYKATLGVLFIDSLQCFDSNYLNKILPIVQYAEDRVYTYDIVDSRKMGWHFTRQYFSTLPMKKKPIKYDIFLVIFDKGRAERAVEYYDYFTSKGYKCLFYISGVKDSFVASHERSGIIYNTILEYQQIIHFISQSRVILEICQKGQNSNTLRAFEAIVYNRKLLTDNPDIISFPYYDPEYIKIFSNINDLEQLNASFFISDSDSVNYHYENDFSPSHLVAELCFGKDGNN